ncbi:hypothetical protein [Tateyamaria sp. Alg231-49]|nr:hypothetical protein [Tateyamaria sp. Alg231-49]
MATMGMLVATINLMVILDGNPMTRPIRGQFGSSKQIERDDG